MRLARVEVDEGEVAAIEHRGALHRVDRLDAILGVALPDDVLPAGSFARRVLSLGAITLAGHAEALADGTQLDDARLPPDARLLPPTGVDPVVLELPADGRSARSFRVSGRALFGHRATGLSARDAGPLSVAPALAIVLGDDLHLPSLAEARDAVLGVTLALAWSLANEREAATREGLGPGPARDVGTHLGPVLTAGFQLDTDVAAELAIGAQSTHLTLRAGASRVAEALVHAARYGELRAGDVLLVAFEPSLRVATGMPVSLRCESLGRLDGQIG